jgi:hypothetical protein
VGAGPASCWFSAARASAKTHSDDVALACGAKRAQRRQRAAWRCRCLPERNCGARACAHDDDAHPHAATAAARQRPAARGRHNSQDSGRHVRSARCVTAASRAGAHLRGHCAARACGVRVPLPGSADSCVWRAEAAQSQTPPTQGGSGALWIDDVSSVRRSVQPHFAPRSAQRTC